MLELRSTGVMVSSFMNFAFVIIEISGLFLSRATIPAQLLWWGERENFILFIERFYS